MTKSPHGWAETTLSEITALGPKSDWSDDTEVGFVPMSHAPTNFRDTLRYESRQWREVKKAYTHFENGDVIFAKVTPCFENGKAALVSGLPNGAGAGSSEFHVLRPASPDVSASYLLAVIKSAQFLREGEESMTGAVGLRRVPRAFVEQFPVALPPAAEQKRIAHKLEALLAQVDTLKARIDSIPAILKRFRGSVLNAAVHGALTKSWRLSRLGCSDLNWRSTAFSEICTEITVGYVGKMADRYQADGIPFLRSQNVRPFRFAPENLLYISNEFHSTIIKSQLKPGDLAIVRSGAPGVTCVIPKTLSVANCSDLVIARPTNELNPEFGCIFMNSEIGKRGVAENQVGVAQQHFNVGSMKKMPILLPPIDEQTEIARRVEHLFSLADQLETKLSAAQKRVDALTQSLLAKAFRGELVPQDPDDEPASVLLERIRAQRAAAPKPKRGRKAAAD